jgi:hypothetical protein
MLHSFSWIFLLLLKLSEIVWADHLQVDAYRLTQLEILTLSLTSAASKDEIFHIH